MINNNLIQQLEERGLIASITDKKTLSQRLKKEPIILYCGFDPTADSLHLGHLIPLLCLKYFQLSGHKPIALIGKATGLVGDPSFKAKERKLNSYKIINQWTKKISRQITQFLDFNCGSNSAIIIDNYDWFHDMNILTFLRDIGKHFSVNQMINKEAVKLRINRNNSGISFTEFSYNLLQAFDFSELYKRYQVEMQIGGSDQWGNIISGIDLTRRIHKKLVFGLTIPLITQENGTKFGKTEKDTIWLSAEKTSPYKFYQFWINTTDEDVYRFLKLFTFLSLKDIQKIENKDKNSDKMPQAQYILAQEVTSLVHGIKGLTIAKRITKNLFSETLDDLSEEDFQQLSQDGIPTIQLLKNIDLQEALVSTKLVSSRKQARVMIESNAISINSKKQTNIRYILSHSDRLFNRYTLLRRGKKHYCLINWK
ncbi:Tyrosine--tRNA ligase [Candidatus Ecksteinia adelgidicola]|nr:Tyrosine--tRNA ligase [Candidatus Ecksteinia adelgidicola]